MKKATLSACYRADHGGWWIYINGKPTAVVGHVGSARAAMKVYVRRHDRDLSSYSIVSGLR